jgi:hypothetical protein
MSGFCNFNSRVRLSFSAAVIVAGLALSQLTCGSSIPPESPAAATSEPQGATPTEPSDSGEMGTGPLPSTGASPAPVATETPDSAGLTGPVEKAGKAPLPAEPGMACLGSFGYGLTCLDDTGWHSYAKDDSPLSSDLIKSITVCPDRRILIAQSSGVSAFDGQAWKEYEQGWGHGSAEAMACDAAGGIWVAHFGGVSYYDGRTWTTYTSEELATGEAATDLVVDVVVAPGGRTWVVTASSVALFDGSEWTVFQVGQGFDDRYYFGRVAVDGHGRPWVVHSRGLLVFDDGDWTSYRNRDLSSVESVAVDAQDRVWVGTFGKGAYVFEGGGWSTYDSASSDLGSDHVRAIAVDGQGRVWLGTEWGLHVLDGEDWRIYRMDNADLSDHDIYALGVVGAGPSLPEVVEKSSGSMRGQVVDGDGQPIAGVPVEVCMGRVSSTYFGDTPCSGEPFVRRVETGEVGHFVIPDLPAGFYAVTMQDGDGNWTQVATELGFVSERVLVGAGEEVYLGELVIGSDE